MSDNIDTLKKLIEPDAGTLANGDPNLDASVAISLRRIADALEKLRDHAGFINRGLQRPR